MSENQTRLTSLIRKYLKDSCTAEELQELWKLLTSVQGEEGITNELNSIWDQVRHEELNMSEISWDNVYDTILIKARNSASQSKLKEKNKIRRMWWAAAAVLFIMLSGGYFFVMNYAHLDNPKQIVHNATKQDIVPGGNKAILTLADGTKVILDSVNNGNITKQGNVTVIKLNDGQLAYQLSTSSTNSTPATVLYNTISTPRGGQYQLILADGSKVWLNAASSIKFPNVFVGKERKVQITGEAYFEVAHNKDMPFRVWVNDMEVEVLGTHFNVNAYTDEPSVNTTLLQGSVKVIDGSNSKIIIPGEQAQIKEGGESGIRVSNVDVNEVIAWKNGLFQFNNADIESIMRQVARWYDVSVVYEGKANETFSGGVPRTEDVMQLLKVLEATGKVSFNLVGKQIIVKQNK